MKKQRFLSETPPVKKYKFVSKISRMKKQRFLFAALPLKKYLFLFTALFAAALAFVGVSVFFSACTPDKSGTEDNPNETPNALYEHGTIKDPSNNSANNSADNPAQIPAAQTFPGTPLSQGARGADVSTIQRCLSLLRAAYPDIPYVMANGFYEQATTAAVTAFQLRFNLTPNGTVDKTTWDKIMEEYAAIYK